MPKKAPSSKAIQAAKQASQANSLIKPRGKIVKTFGDSCHTSTAVYIYSECHHPDRPVLTLQSKLNFLAFVFETPFGTS